MDVIFPVINTVRGSGPIWNVIFPFCALLLHLLDTAIAMHEYIKNVPGQGHFLAPSPRLAKQTQNNRICAR
jgi:hypothetical protein